MRTDRYRHRPSDGRRAGSDPIVVKELGALRDSPYGKLVVRILRLDRGGLRVDVRELVENERFHGFTRKGVCLSLEEFRALVEQRGAIEAALEDRTPARDRRRRSEASS